MANDREYVLDIMDSAMITGEVRYYVIPARIVHDESMLHTFSQMLHNEHARDWIRVGNIIVSTRTNMVNAIESCIDHVLNVDM